MQMTYPPKGVVTPDLTTSGMSGGARTLVGGTFPFLRPPVEKTAEQASFGSFFTTPVSRGLVGT
jgi:hypothetical protein